MDGDSLDGQESAAAHANAVRPVAVALREDSHLGPVGPASGPPGPVLNQARIQLIEDEHDFDVGETSQAHQGGGLKPGRVQLDGHDLLVPAVPAAAGGSLRGLHPSNRFEVHDAPS